jgi:hypothetical protein
MKSGFWNFGDSDVNDIAIAKNNRLPVRMIFGLIFHVKVI